jgi:hypothetical protein
VVTIKSKGSSRPKGESRASRSNFASNDETATIEELLDDISAVHQTKGGEPITFLSLDNTLAFIKQVTGVSIKLGKKPIPVNILNLIKLLFLKNAESEKHLFSLLALPEPGEESMEFATSTTNSRDQKTARIIDAITSELALEIPQEKLTLLSQMLGNLEQHSAMEKFLLHIGRASDDVARILHDRFQDDVPGLANAYHTLARAMPGVAYDETVEGPATSLHEAMFVHLNTLAFKHFVPHHRRHVRAVSIKEAIVSISADAEAFLASISKDAHRIVSPYEKCFSVKNFHSVVFGYPKEIAALVKKATGIETGKEIRQYRLFRNTVRAKGLLYAYGVRSYDEGGQEASILSLIDILAALCSFSYQQKIHTKYKPYWHGQVTQGDDPQWLYDRGWWQKESNKKNSMYVKGYVDQHQHQGVFQLYYYRFCEFQAAFTDTKPSYHGRMAYQLARLEAYKRIVQSDKIVDICTAAARLDRACVEAAMNVASDYPRFTYNVVLQAE